MIKIIVQSVTGEIYTKGNFDSISIPTNSGVIQILNSHEEMSGLIAPGIITVVGSGSNDETFKVIKGCYMVSHNEVTAVIYLQKEEDNSHHLFGEDKEILFAEEEIYKDLVE